MKGVIFNVVEEVVTAAYGADTWDALLADNDLAGAYTALGNYDDTELTSIVGSAATMLGVSEADVLRTVGRGAFAGLARRYAQFLAGHESSRTVLADLHAVIHPQVLALYPDASVPEFDFADHRDALELDYRSSRGLCHLAEGLAAGVADHFSEVVKIEQPLCRHRGDDRCLLRVTYSNG